MDNRQQLRLRVVQYHLENDMSFRQTALKFHVAYCTVFKWVRSYKKNGEKGLLSTYKRPWNRAKPDVEEKLVLMKEHDPGLTVRRAKENLENQGLRVSVKGIWGIWKRHGYAGIDQEKMTGSYTDCPWTKEAEKKHELGKWLFERGLVMETAELLNSIPALPGNALLPQIPDSRLGIRRQIEKTGLLFGKVPVRSYLKRLRILYEECRRQNLYYSALIVGLIETKALSWSGEPLEMLNKAVELRGVLEKTGNHRSYSLLPLRLSLLISEGFAYTGLLKMKEAAGIARTCRIVLKRRRYTSPLFMRDLGQLYSQLEDFREAKYWYLRSADGLDGEEAKITRLFLADIFTVRGEYRKALEILKNEELDHWGSHSQKLRIRSMWSLAKGMPDRAISLAAEVLASLEKEKAKGSMFGCYFTIASAYCSLGEKIRARRMLKKILPFLTKNQLDVVKTIIDVFLAQTAPPADSLRLREQASPTIKLALLLRSGQYTRALKYAEKKGIMAFLHRYIFFFPEAITDLLKQGKPTGLPRAMLNLPVFRKEIPVYSVRFLGDLIVYKNQKYLKIRSAKKRRHVAISEERSPEADASRVSTARQKFSAGTGMTPQDTAFLIHLATARSRHIALDRIYKDLWPHSEKPARNLAHLLVRIRKVLRLPSHFLYVERNRLCFDCHFITDYNEYQEHLAQAKAFTAAGEWALANTEYIHAFALFRDAPFKKMYDGWSEDMRSMVLGNLENEAIRYAQASSAHGDRETGITVLQKISRIIPNSEEIKSLASKSAAVRGPNS